MTKKIAILTVNFNGEEKTLKFIKSLEKSNFKNYTIFVVDNNSELASFNSLKGNLKRYGKKVILLRSKKNLGWGLGCNIGLREITKSKKYDYTFVAGNDSEFEKNTLRSCLEVMEENSNIGICGIKSIGADGKIQTTGGKIKFISKLTGILFENKERLMETKPVILENNEFVDDFGWMIRTSSEKELVLYPNHLFMYFEELYINREIERMGKIRVYNPRATLKHVGYGSSGVKKNAIPVFYLARNRYIFMKDFFPMYLPIFLLVYTGVILPSTAIKYYYKKRRDLIPYLFKGAISGVIYLLTKRKFFLFRENQKYLVKEVN